jgi:hypothetical protein
MENGILIKDMAAKRWNGLMVALIGGELKEGYGTFSGDNGDRYIG